MGGYIERETVFKIMDNSERPENDRMDIGYNDALNDIKQRLAEIPAADVQLVTHGYWEECEIRGTLTQSCSVCGNDCGVLYPYDFCPNCGARMDLKDGDTKCR